MKSANNSVYVMDGVGDIWWVYTKLKSLDIPLDFKVIRHAYKTQKDGPVKSSPKRAHQLIELLPNCTCEYMDVKSKFGFDNRWFYTNYIPKESNADDILREIRSDKQRAIFPNVFMEKGVHLNNIWPELPLNYELELGKEYDLDCFQDINKDTVFIHPGTYADKTQWSDMPTELILELAEMMHNLYRMKVGITGAKFDNVNYESIFTGIKERLGYEPVSLVGAHLGSVLSGIQKSAGWVGPINGLGIMVASLGTPATTLWRKHLKKMIHTIENPMYSKNVNRRIHNPHVIDVNNLFNNSDKVKNNMREIKLSVSKWIRDNRK